MADATATQTKWDGIYRGLPPDGTPEPARVLAENAHLLPPTGTALDLACGLGGNALFLARRGLETHAYDISPVAIELLSVSALSLRLTLRAEVRDALSRPPEPASFDVIVISRFLERSLAGCLVDALRPGGLLFYQTFIRDKATATGPSNPAYLLDANELLDLFRGLRLVAYREEGRIGDLTLGLRNEAWLIGQKI